VIASELRSIIGLVGRLEILEPQFSQRRDETLRNVAMAGRVQVLARSTRQNPALGLGVDHPHVVASRLRS